MEISERYRFAQHIRFDDYDGYGYLLDIRQGVLEELSEEETALLTRMLSSVTEGGKATILWQQKGGQHLEEKSASLLNRLQRQGFLEMQSGNGLELSQKIGSPATSVLRIQPFFVNNNEEQ